MTETELRSWCLSYLHRLGVMAWKNNTGFHIVPETDTTDKRAVRYGDPGSPDILGILRSQEGRILCIETKVGHNRLSTDQADWLQRAWDSGAAVAVIFSTEEMVSYAECGFGSDFWKERLDYHISRARPPKPKKARGRFWRRSIPHR